MDMIPFSLIVACIAYLVMHAGILSAIARSIATVAALVGAVVLAALIFNVCTWSATVLRELLDDAFRGTSVTPNRRSRRAEAKKRKAAAGKSAARFIANSID